jgi:hypothetical protein
LEFYLKNVNLQKRETCLRPQPLGHLQGQRYLIVIIIIIIIIMMIIIIIIIITITIAIIIIIIVMRVFFCLP